MLAISERITRFTCKSFGPYSSQQGHVYLLGSGKEKSLIDTGNGHPDYLYEMKEYLKATKSTITTVFSTHSHISHTGGNEYLKNLFPNAFNNQRISEKSIVKTVNTPGHCDDHISYFMEREGALFCGDSIKPFCQCLYSNLREFKSSLKKMADLYPFLLLQSHGEVCGNPYAELDSVHNQLLQLDEQLLRICPFVHFVHFSQKQMFRCPQCQYTNQPHLQFSPSAF
jgi:endoribonuclease LACTB2